MQIILAVILFSLMLIIGGDRGATSFISLCGNCIILGITVFLMYTGFNYIVVTIIGCLLISILTIFYPNGINKKSMASFLSVLIVLTILFFGTFVVEQGLKTKGFSIEQQMEDSMSGLLTDVNINMYRIVISMIMMSLMGAVLDASVSIASSVYEVYEHNPHLGKIELFFSGLRIGRDIIGTTINTLFFAYLGESMMLLIRFHIEGYSFGNIINSKSFCQEFVRIIFSGASCVLIIPVTAFILAKLLKKDDVKHLI